MLLLFFSDENRQHAHKLRWKHIYHTNFSMHKNVCLNRYVTWTERHGHLG